MGVGVRSPVWLWSNGSTPHTSVPGYKACFPTAAAHTLTVFVLLLRERRRLFWVPRRFGSSEVSHELDRGRGTSLLKGQDGSEGREGAVRARAGGLQVVLGDVVVLGRVALVGRPAAGAVRRLGGRAPALLLGKGRRRVRRPPRGRGPVRLGTAAQRRLERVAEKRGAGLPRGLRQRAEVAGRVLRYLVCVREVLLEEFVVGIVMICVRNGEGTWCEPRGRGAPPPPGLPVPLPRPPGLPDPAVLVLLRLM